MRIAGVIAEYNPFHNGHAHQIATLRGMGFDAVICVCSPSVVQRGTPALLPAQVRTRAALAAGVDLVLCLPAPYATCSAEGFARAGVFLLSALGVCEAVAFGAETPNASTLLAVAHALQTETCSAALRAQLAQGLPFAAARAAAAESVLPGASSLLKSPNNILAVEYCKALDAFSAPTQPDGFLSAEKSTLAGLTLPYPLALPREGAQHDAPLTQAAMQSASALRALAAHGGMCTLAPYVPAACLPFYIEAEQAGHFASSAAFGMAVLSRLRGMDMAEMASIRGACEGLEHRLFSAVRTATDLPQLYDALKTKRYAHARMRRLVLNAALCFTDGLPATPPYLHVLGASRAGLAVLKAAQAKARLPLSHALRCLEKRNPETTAIARAHAAAEDFAALCLRKPLPMGTAYTDKTVIFPK